MQQQMSLQILFPSASTAPTSRAPKESTYTQLVALSESSIQDLSRIASFDLTTTTVSKISSLQTINASRLDSIVQNGLSALWRQLCNGSPESYLQVLQTSTDVDERGGYASVWIFAEILGPLGSTRQDAVILYKWRRALGRWVLVK